jgi:hypothetical protein
MGEVSTIGLDIAKSVFQVHGVDVAGAVVIRKRVSRAKVLEYFGELPPCLVGIEACPSAHHWGRELQARRRETHDPSQAFQWRGPRPACPARQLAGLVFDWHCAVPCISPMIRRASRNVEISTS